MSRCERCGHVLEDGEELHESVNGDKVCDTCIVHEQNWLGDD